VRRALEKLSLKFREALILGVQAAASATEQCAAEKHLGAQGGGLPIGGEAASALEFSELIEQLHDAPEGCFGGEELLQTKIFWGRIVFQFRDAISHVCPAIVVAPDFFRRQNEIGHKDAKGVAGNLQWNSAI
jgi:hypothetical protein